MNLPRGARTPYAAQTVCVDFHSSPDDGACARLPKNENSYTMNLGSLRSQREGILTLRIARLRGKKEKR
jgi:hypothetical protein